MCKHHFICGLKHLCTGGKISPVVPRKQKLSYAEDIYVDIYERLVNLTSLSHNTSWNEAKWEV